MTLRKKRRGGAREGSTRPLRGRSDLSTVLEEEEGDGHHQDGNDAEDERGPSRSGGRVVPS